MALTKLSSADAREVACRHTYYARPALTWTRPKHNVDEPFEWTTSDYPETFYGWKIEGLRIYLELGASVPSALPGCFPAQFDFEDGRRAWPDKAVVKIGLKMGFLVPLRSPGNPLFFKVTDAGQNRISPKVNHALPPPFRP